MTTSRLNRSIDLAQSLLNRLAGSSPLSILLPDARLIAQAAGRSIDVRWLDFEIYGTGNVPGQSSPLKTAEEKAGFMKFWSLHETEDITKVTIDQVLKESRSGERPRLARGYLIPQSISELESILSTYRPLPDDYIRANPDDGLRMSILHKGQTQVPPRVLAAVHQMAGEVLDALEEERDNLQLLGPDYRFVLDNLAALDSEVGDELQTALRSLRGETPADWSAAVLLCRNAVIKLGPLLFSSSVETYHSEMAGKDLDLKGEKEKNRLLAYIDSAWRNANGAGKTNLQRTADLVISVYERGSAGKRAVRFADAQQTVVDTFEMVALLTSMTDLEALQ